MTTPTKEGLDSALDFTKFLITADGALIAFVTGTTFLKDIDRTGEKIAVLVALLALVVSIVGGLFVAMGVASKLSRGDHDLLDPILRWPGLVNVLGFGVGASAVAALAIVELVWAGPAPASRPFAVHCTAAAADNGVLRCAGKFGGD